MKGVKQLKKRFKDFLIIAICLIVAITFGFYIVPKDNQQTRETTIVVRLKNNLGENQEVRSSDLELVEVGSYGLSRDVVLDMSEIVGKYTTTALPKGVNALHNYFQDDKVPINAFLYENPDYDAISFDTNLTRAVAGIAEQGDFVRAIIYIKPENSGADSRVLMLPELENLEIINITNNRGNNLTEVEGSASNDNVVPAVVTVKATERQQSLLVKYMNDGVIHLSLRPRILNSNNQESKIVDSSRIQDENLITTNPETVEENSQTVTNEASTESTTQQESNNQLNNNTNSNTESNGNTNSNTNRRGFGIN